MQMSESFCVRWIRASATNRGQRWATKIHDLEWTDRIYVLFAMSEDRDFAGLTSRNVAFVGMRGQDGQREWEWTFFYRNPARLLRQVGSRLDRLDEQLSRPRPGDGRWTRPVMPIASKYASMDEACGVAAVRVADAMRLGVSLRAIIGMKLPGAMDGTIEPPPPCDRHALAMAAGNPRSPGPSEA